MAKTQAAPKCIGVSCKGAVAFHVLQKWNGQTIHTCIKHFPGNGGKHNPKPAPTARTENAFYVTTPIDQVTV